jgi:hypothetical protein
VRVRESLHALLIDAARKSGRTLSQEAEFRLEQSFAAAGKDLMETILDNQVRLSDALRSVGEHLASIAEKGTDPAAVLEQAKGFQAHASALLKTIPSRKPK